MVSAKTYEFGNQRKYTQGMRRTLFVCFHSRRTRGAKSSGWARKQSSVSAGILSCGLESRMHTLPRAKIERQCFFQCTRPIFRTGSRYGATHLRSNYSCEVLWGCNVWHFLQLFQLFTNSSWVIYYNESVLVTKDQIRDQHWSLNAFGHYLHQFLYSMYLVPQANVQYNRGKRARNVL